MNSCTKFRALIEDPVALRGIDRMIERVGRVLDRYMRTPVRKPDPKPLARIA
jgi:hypothetical protein